ncbi:MAG: transcription termination/antitermination protein NusA [Gammaproteobacteria bacterium]|jgi:N utilization substance protein A|nr:transcription termination/antitermination protein NusA [Gammaproteobacteria bacterium]
MKNRELILVIESLANEKSIAPETIFRGIEKALSSVLAKQLEGDVDIRTHIDRQSGVFNTKRIWTVVQEQNFVNPDAEIDLVTAQKTYDNINIGDEIEEEITQEDLGRIAAHQTKQIITRFVREAERAKYAEHYESLIGEIITGKVKRVTREGIIIELSDGVEGHLARNHILPREIFRTGDSVRAYLEEINWEMKGQLLVFSRTHNQMLGEMFRMEVPEIADGLIEIRAIARDPGNRSKIAVKANDARIDPIGACIGIRGTRVQTVSNELGGERIDIILWDNEPGQLAINALTPAEVLAVEVNEADRKMKITVSEETLSQAIGKNGQNIRLASSLIGWKLDVKGPQEDITPEQKLSQDLAMKLDIDEEIAQILIREGFKHISSIAQASISEIAAIDEFDEEIAQAINERSKEALLTSALDMTDANHISNLPSMSADLISQLTSKGITQSSDIADMDTDELMSIIEISEEAAAKIILEARQPWFDQ